MKKLREIFSNRKTFWFLGTFIAGVVFWVGFTSAVHYMDTPEFCGTCHIMDDVVNSHAASAHADLECGSCHVPAGNIATKMIYKAKVGTGHVYYNLFAQEDIPNLLKAKEETKEVVEANCISCHKAMLGNVEHTAKEDCGSCHRGLPHGQQSFKTKEWNKEPKPGELLKNKEGVF
ncbi:MAG: nitrate/TMAO reductase rane-bound tetraheme cytochrome subunit [Bacillales bacterium]|nr:nitrate/TMAO reductase rane-bound tetraheme cytochrome subunit [Bacillales bacterium]